MATGCGTITVEAPFDRGAVGIVGCSGVPSTATVGETVTTTVDVENANEMAVEVTLVLSGAGEQLASKTVTVGADRTVSETVGFQVPNAPGDMAVEATLDSIVQGGSGFNLSLGSLLGRNGESDHADGRERDRPTTY